MPVLLEQSEATAARRRWPFACVDDTDGKTAEPGLTFSGAELQISKNGAAFASFAGSVTELTDGAYVYEATAAELDTLGFIVFKIEKTGVRTVLLDAAQVVPWDPYASALPANVTAMAADVVTAAAVAAGAIDKATFAQDALDLFNHTRRNTATAGAAATITLDASASAVDDFYNDALILLVANTGSGQFRRITDYVGSTKVATVDHNWTTNPDATTVFQITAQSNVATGSPGAGSITRATFSQDALDLFSDIRRATAQTGSTTTITLDASASSTNDIYNGSKITIVSGTGVGQSRGITDYVGSTKVATVNTTWAITPDNTSVFEIFGSGASGSPTEIADTILGTAVEGSNTLADMIRALVSLNGCRVTNFTTGTLVFKSIDGTKTRWTAIADSTGRLSISVGDLT